MNGDVLEFVAFETLNISNIKSARRNFSVGQDLDVSGKVTIGSSLTVASDLVVNGTFTTINTEILDVEDKTIGIASTSSPSNTTADGAGIVIYGGTDGDKSLTWNTEKSNFVLVGGGVSIGTGVTISTPAANVLAFSVNSAEKARFNNFGAFTVGYEGEAWKESTYVGVLQAGSGAWIGQTPGAGARAEWVNNAYYDSVNTRWEYIAADEANRIYLENGEIHLQSAAAGSADGAITWNEKLAMTVGGDFKIGPTAGIGITLSSSGNIDAIGVITATSFSGDGTGITGIGVTYTAVAGVATLAQGLTGSPNITVGTVNASSFIGDGSGITGVTASGTGIIIRDSGTLVGTIGTINFGTNLSVSAASAGVVTVTASGGGGGGLSGIVIQEETSSVGSAQTINFVGSAVTATYSGGVATIDMSGAVPFTGAATAITALDISQYEDAYAWGNHASAGYLTNINGSNLGDLSNVSSATPNANEVLTWSGSQWAAAASSGGSLTIKEEGSDVGSNITSINFVGSGVTATASGAGATITITATGGGGGVSTTGFGTFTASAGVEQQIDSFPIASYSLSLIHI